MLTLFLITSLSCNNSNEGPREIKSVTEKLLKSGQPLHGLPTSDIYSPKPSRLPEALTPEGGEKYGIGDKPIYASDHDILKDFSGGTNANASAPKCINLDLLVNQETTNSVPGSGKLSVRALRKTGLRIQEVAGATPILYNDLQIPITNARKL